MHLTLSQFKHTKQHYPVLAHLNASSSFNIDHRDLPMVSFNLELNSTHFPFKIVVLHEKLVGHLIGERTSLVLFSLRAQTNRL